MVPAHCRYSSRPISVDPVNYLVLPRVVALTVMCPILTAFSDLVGIFEEAAGAHLIDADGNPTDGTPAVVETPVVVENDEDRKARLLELAKSNKIMEKEIKSVANITAGDIREFLDIAAAIPIRPEIQTYPLEDANQAIMELRDNTVKGAKVLLM